MLSLLHIWSDKQIQQDLDGFTGKGPVFKRCPKDSLTKALKNATSNLREGEAAEFRGIKKFKMLHSFFTASANSFLLFFL